MRAGAGFPGCRPSGGEHCEKGKPCARFLSQAHGFAFLAGEGVFARTSRGDRFKGEKDPLRDDGFPSAFFNGMTDGAFRASSRVRTFCI